MHELPSLFRDHQVRLAQQIKVIGNTRQTHDKVPADFAHRQLPFPQQLQNAPSRRIIQRPEKLRYHI